MTQFRTKGKGKDRKSYPVGQARARPVGRTMDMSSNNYAEDDDEEYGDISPHDAFLLEDMQTLENDFGMDGFIFNKRKTLALASQDRDIFAWSNLDYPLPKVEIDGFSTDEPDPDTIKYSATDTMALKLDSYLVNDISLKMSQMINEFKEHGLKLKPSEIAIVFSQIPGEKNYGEFSLIPYKNGFPFVKLDNQYSQRVITGVNTPSFASYNLDTFLSAINIYKSIAGSPSNFYLSYNKDPNSETRSGVISAYKIKGKTFFDIPSGVAVNSLQLTDSEINHAIGEFRA